MKPPPTPPYLGEESLPPSVAAPACVFAKNYGVPAGSIAIVMMSVLGGILAGGIRLNFAGRFRPLGMHTLIATAPAPEMHGWLDHVIAPLEEEVGRLIEHAKENPDIEKIYVDYLRLLQASGADGINSAQLGISIRNIAPLVYPFLFVRGLPSKNLRDGLAAPVLFPDLETLLADDPSKIGQLAATFDNVPGATTTLLAILNHTAIHQLAELPEASGWPFMVLPQRGAAFAAVGSADLDQADQTWRRLVQAALALRYRPSQPIEPSLGCLNRLTSIIDGWERSYVKGLERLPPWCLAALLRLAAVEHLITAMEPGTVEATHVDQIEPMVRWAIACYKPLIGHRRRKTNNKNDSGGDISPADIARLRSMKAKFPQRTNRDMQRALPKRQRGYWQGALRLLADFASDTSDTSDKSDTSDTS